MSDNKNAPGSEGKNERFNTAFQSNMPKQDKKIDGSKQIKLLMLGVAGLLMFVALFFYVTKKPSSTQKPGPVSKADRVIQDVQNYRAQENDLTKLDTLAFPSTNPSTPGAKPESPLSAAMGELLASRNEGQGSTAPDPDAPIRSTSRPSQGQVRYQDPPQASAQRLEPPRPAEYVPTREMQMRLSKPYAEVMALLDGQQILARPAGEMTNMVPNPSAGLDSQYRTLSEKVPSVSGFGRRHIAAGTELRGYTNEALNTDYPSIIKGTLTSPPEVRGAIVLISYRLNEERAMANVEKIIMPSLTPLKPPTEVAVQSVVKDGLPGLGGDVNHHWIPQIAASVANASMTAGALYYAAKSGNNNDLGTAVLLQPAIEKGIEGATKPLNYLGRERNITVTVEAGKEFTVLVTQGFEIP